MRQMCEDTFLEEGCGPERQAWVPHTAACPLSHHRHHHAQNRDKGTLLLAALITPHLYNRSSGLPTPASMHNPDLK